MRTIVYVDGYNFYYGLLKHSPYKWLDIFKLFQDQILKPQNPAFELIKVKFFTADILGAFASKEHLAVESQRQYHKALRSSHTGPVEIYSGYYAAEKSSRPVFREPPCKHGAWQLPVWRLEEKQTDVSMALHIYRDAMKGECDQVVVCSNDTDLEPPLSLIKQDLPDFPIGVVLPVKEPNGEDRRRPPNAKLSQYAEWTRRHVPDHELANSVFPEKVRFQAGRRQKTAVCPEYWR